MKQSLKVPLRFQFQAADLVFHPCLSQTQTVQSGISAAFPLNYEVTCASPNNQYQLTSTFDKSVSEKYTSLGCLNYEVQMPDDLKKEHDFAYHIASQKVVFEVEKANWEKILYDLLKSHIYLSCGADIAVLMLPRNWCHTNGEENVFEIGKTRYQQAIRYGMGKPELFERIILVGFNQYYSGKIFTQTERKNIRRECESYFSNKSV